MSPRMASLSLLLTPPASRPLWWEAGEPHPAIVRFDRYHEHRCNVARGTGAEPPTREDTLWNALTCGLHAIAGGR